MRETELESGKMGIRLILFKEISFGISLNNRLSACRASVIRQIGRKNQENDFSFLK